jgi:6-pyruvoyl-tetrahydropterin synthase
MIRGEVDDNGILLEYGEVKKVFRGFLDTTFDHRLLLNASDSILSMPSDVNVPEWIGAHFPGAQFMQGDPTTENVANAIYSWAMFEFNQSKYQFSVTVWETAVNCATVGDF